MEKIEKTIAPVTIACSAQQLYLLGTYNTDGTPFLQSQAFACYIPGPPEGMVIGVVASSQMKENIVRERAFSLNQCNIDMRFMVESAWRGYAPKISGEGSIGFSCGTKLNVPVLDASPYVTECKVTQSLQVGDTTIFISEIACIHSDCRYLKPYPESGDTYSWYTDQDVKDFNPLLYSVKYYTVSESLGQLDRKNW